MTIAFACRLLEQATGTDLAFKIEEVAWIRPAEADQYLSVFEQEAITKALRSAP